MSNEHINARRTSYEAELKTAISGGYESEDAKQKNIFSYTYYGNYEITHNHDYWEFIIVLSGDYTHSLNGKNIALNKNHACLLRPNVDYHCLKNGPHGSKHFTIRIRDSYMQSICNTIHENFYNDLFSRSLIMLPLSDAQIDHIINYTTLIGTNNAEEGRVPTHFLITYILEKIVGKTNFLEQNKPQWFSELLLAINSPQNMHWSVNDIVECSNFSHTHLLRVFKQYENCSLVEYLTKVKMMHVCTLLLYSNMSILEIALMLGYSDSSHLTRTFKKIYHISPRQFKQNNKN